MFSNCAGGLLRVPRTARRWNQSTLKEINPEYSLEGLMLKLKLQSFDHLMWRADSLEKTLMQGKIEDKRRGQQRMRWSDGITNSMGMNLSKLWKTVVDRGTWHAAVHRVQESRARLRGWMTRQIQTHCPLWLYLFVKPMAYAAVSSHKCQILILSNF